MTFTRPVSVRVPNVTNPFSATHKGTDYGYPVGTPLYASADGRVTIVKSNEARQWIANTASDPYKPASGARALRTEDYGNFVKIDHGQGYETLYAHQKLNGPIVKLSQQVKKGELIGFVGSTGNSTGNHVHWEVRKNGVVIDPLPLFDSSFTNYFDPRQIQQPADVIAALRKEADTNWNAFVAICTALGVEVKSEDKDGTVQRAKTVISELYKQAANNDAEKYRHRLEQFKQLANQPI
jgi:murein DD-endopeptidase MepM/ murein hydrolase activator NlpD